MKNSYPKGYWKKIEQRVKENDPENFLIGIYLCGAVVVGSCNIFLDEFSES